MAYGTSDDTLHTYRPDIHVLGFFLLAIHPFISTEYQLDKNE